MKKVISLFLLIIISWQFAFKAGYIFYWKMNQQEITEKYCENKDQPEMQCCGKCHLEKQLNIVESNEDSKSNFPLEIFKLKSVEVFLVNSFTFCFHSFQAIEIKSKEISYLIFPILKGFLISILHPPEFSQ